MHVREREERTSVFWGLSLVTIGETGGVDLYSYFFGPLIQAFSFAYKEKRKYPGENLFYWLHNTGIVKPISYPGQVEN